MTKKKFVALISGGKDSFYTIHTLSNTYELVACLYIKSNDIDSYMYQTAGYQFINYYKKVLNVPLYIYETDKKVVNKELEYKETKNDEVEIMYYALKDLKLKHKFEFVSSGAIKSNYQYLRVKNICERLNLISLSPLFNKDQNILFKLICKNLKAVFVKTASPIFNESFIGKEINFIEDKIIDNKCGEGGEYESIVLDAPFFKKKLNIKKFDVGYHPDEIGKEKNVFFMENAVIEIIEK